MDPEYPQTGDLRTNDNSSSCHGQKDLENNSSQLECKLSLAGDFTFSCAPNFEDIRVIQSQFVKDRNWGQFHKPTNLLLAMIKEVGEVSELFQWKDGVHEGLPDWTEEEKTHLAQELSDVYIYLQSLAEKCHIDLPQAVIQKMKLNAQKYPAEKVWGSSKKYTEYKL